MKEDLLVSICIPTYNGASYLAAALQSVKNQTYKNIEVVISDDNSTDETLLICEDFKKEVAFPVQIIKHKPSGIGANWDNCVKHSNGDYVKLLFQDDLLAEDCIEKMMAVLIKEKLEIVVCKRRIIDHKGEDLETDWLQRFGDLQKSFGIEKAYFYRFNKRNLLKVGKKQPNHFNFIGEPVTALFTKKLYGDIGDFSSPLKQYLDLEYWLKILRKYDIGIMDEKLISFRVHEAQSSNTNHSQRTTDEKAYIEKMLFRYFFWQLSLKLKKYFLVKFIKGNFSLLKLRS